MRLDIADYFHHGPKQGTFSDNQKEDLNNIMKSKYYKDPKHTVWESMVILWKDAHPKCKNLPEDLKMPDYTKIP